MMSSYLQAYNVLSCLTRLQEEQWQFDIFCENNKRKFEKEKCTPIEYERDRFFNTLFKIQLISGHLPACSKEQDLQLILQCWSDFSASS